MEDGGSIVEFFYNLVPGTLFLFLLQYFQIIPWFRGLDIYLIFLYIILGLFFGFLFQGITAFLRKGFWNYNCIQKVMYEKRRNKREINPILNYVYKKYIYKKNIVIFNSEKIEILSPEEMKKIFHLMDNRLMSENATFLPTHFSSLFTFWSNIFIGATFFLYSLEIKISFGIDFDKPIFSFLTCSLVIKLLLILLVCVFVIFSSFTGNYYLKAFYDSILNRYYLQKEKSK